jgi:uroporphyrin-III C-methyltransferase
VPGVSSAIAAPAYAGIPLTFRHIATAFAVVTGHEAPGKGQSQTDWGALARIPTLVVLMGLHRADTVCAALIAAGRAPTTPAAVVSRATTSEQRVLVATLATMPEALRASPLATPAVLVIGEVAGLAEQLAWFDPEEATSSFAPFGAITTESV